MGDRIELCHIPFDTLKVVLQTLFHLTVDCWGKFNKVKHAGSLLIMLHNYDEELYSQVYVSVPLTNL